MKRLLALLVLALAPVALAYDDTDIRYATAAGSSTDWSSPEVGPAATSGPTNITYTSSSNGYCGEATIFDSASDVLELALKGITHCDATDSVDSDGDGTDDCSAEGEQLMAVSVQFWYSCDDDGDGTCDHSPAYSSTLLGRTSNSQTPTLLKYDGSSPYDTYRFYQTADQETVSSTDLLDGDWHKVYLSYDIASNSKKLCIDDTCVTDTTTAVTAYAYTSGDDLVFGQASSQDSDPGYGVYDEIQIAIGYDFTFGTDGGAEDGPGCGFSETATKGTESLDEHPWGMQTNYSCCTGGIELEVRSDDNAAAPLVGYVSSTNWTSDIGLIYTNPQTGGGPDYDGDGDAQLSERARCINTGATNDYADSNSGDYLNGANAQQESGAATATAQDDEHVWEFSGTGSATYTLYVVHDIGDLFGGDRQSIYYSTNNGTDWTLLSNSTEMKQTSTVDVTVELQDLQVKATAPSSNASPDARVYEIYVRGEDGTWSSFSSVTAEEWPSSKLGEVSEMQHARWVFMDNFERPDLTGALEEGDPSIWTHEESGYGGLNLSSGNAQLSGSTQYGSGTDEWPFSDMALRVQATCSSCTLGVTDFSMKLRYDTDGDGLEFYRCKLEGGTSGIEAKWNKLHDTDGDGAIDAGEYGAQQCVSSEWTATYPIWVHCEVYDDPDNAGRVIFKMWTAPDSSGVPGTWTLRSAGWDEGGSNCDCTNGTKSSNWNLTSDIVEGHGGMNLMVEKTGDHRYHEVYLGKIMTNEPRGGRRTP